MEINWSIAGWIIAILVFYTIGFYEGRGNGYKRRKREEAQEKKVAPAPVPEESIPLRADDAGVLRIKIENGVPLLDLDGTRTNPSALLPNQTKRLTDLLTLIHGWSGDPLIPAPQVEKLPPLFTPPPASAQPATPPLNTLFASLTAAPKRTTDTQEDRPKPAAGSIVGQIDSILQTQMIGTSLMERRIYLTESPEGGVMVNVGTTKYMGIDDVPDNEIKTAIRIAIAEWEKKYTPGLK
jgi:hypothetical protein